jgi:nucleoside-triphosphatase THEP1
MKLNAGGLSSIVIGREKEIIALKQYIKFSQHTALTAPRRYGKTTLVNRVLDDLKNQYLIVKVDIFEATTIKELCEIYLNAIYKSIGIANFLYSIKESIFNLLDNFKLQYEQNGIKIGYEITKEQDENKLLEKTFHFADKFATLFDKKMVVFFDEFGDVQKYGEDFLKKIRSYLQTHKNVVYIFAGSQTSVINKIFLNEKNAFFNFATLMNLNFLDKKSTIEFLKNLKIENKTFNDNSISLLYEKTKFHPFYLIKTIQESFIASLFDNSLTIASSHINKAISKILDDNNAYFETIWQQINSKKYKGAILKSIINRNLTIQISSSYKSQLLKELKSGAVIDNSLNFTDPFFKLWMIKKIL